MFEWVARAVRKWSQALSHLVPVIHLFPHFTTYVVAASVVYYEASCLFVL